jgi:tetratricopeptide (TPR) repeat protein
MSEPAEVARPGGAYQTDLVECLRKEPPEIPDERALLLLAHFYWATGRVTESLTCLKLIEQRDELSPAELQLRGYWQLYVGDSRGALQTFKAAIGRNSSDPATRLGYGFALFYVGDYKAAAAAFDELSKGGQFHSPPVMAAASKALANGERPAVIQMAPIPGLPPGVADVLQVKLIHGVAPAINEALARLPMIAPEKRLPLQRVLAELYLDSREEQTALVLLDDALETHPQDGLLLLFKGVALHRTGERERSHESFRQAVAVAPLEPRTWGGFAAGCFEVNEFDEAVKAYRIAIFLDDHNANFWGDLGMIESQREQYDKARRAITKSIDLGLVNFSNYFNRGFCCVHLGETEAALKDWLLAITIEPDHPRVNEVRALLNEFSARLSDRRFVFDDSS